MKKIVFVFPMCLIIALFACKNKAGETAGADQPTVAQPSGTQPSGANAESSEQTGTVVEFLNASNYTYVRVDTGREKIWAAAPAFEVKVGEKVTVPPGLPMKNYHSQSLERTFDVVYFVSNITKAGSKVAPGSQLPEGHPNVGTGNAAGAPATAKTDFSGIAKPKGGKTVAEIYKEKANLAGKEVAVRGKVVKFLSGIMGKNWIHLRDGTGAEGTNDLTVTTDAQTKVGDTVLVKGLLVTDKDYGFGYQYGVIIENAKVTAE